MDGPSLPMAIGNHRDGITYDDPLFAFNSLWSAVNLTFSKE